MTTTRLPQCLLVFPAAFTLAVLVAVPADAQEYFGRNKVQYQKFTWEVLKTEHFDIHFYPEEREAAPDVGRMAERWYARLSTILQHDLSSRQPLVLYASNPDFWQTNVITGDVGEGTGGVTEGFKRRIVMPLAATMVETDHVLGHELVHAFQYDLARGRTDGSLGSGLERLPLWFIEGMAEYLSRGHVDAHTAMWIRDSAREGSKLPSVKQLGDPDYFPYRWGQALWAYVAGQHGDSVVRRVFDEAVRAGDARAGFEEALGIKEQDLSERWHQATRQQYSSILAATSRASGSARWLTAEDKTRGAIAVSPVLSPDGRRIAYLSGRDLLSVDLYLADVESGRVLRKLVNTATDPHFSSIQFIASAGTWHPTGRQFAFGAIRHGEPVLAIVDADNGERLRDIPLPELGEVLNPSWSPDGRSIAFSATAGGRSDIFVYELEKSTLRRLTNDAYGDLQPAWSPDGSRLAFATDRFSSDLSRLAPGRFSLAIFELSSGSIEALDTFDTGKAINPQWAPGGRQLYFLSDATGISNVYTIDLEGRRVRRVTNLDAGASGITALSPALTTAVDASRIAFSGYEDGRLGIYVVEGRERLAGEPVATATAALTGASVLPPSQRASSEVAQFLNDPVNGLPEESGSTTPYKSGLSIDAVGQPYVSAGVNRFGGVYGGGISFSFSDMLGTHNLFAAIDTNSYGGFSDIYKNTGVFAAYSNLGSRWNWGLSGGQMPYLAGGYGTGVANVNGQSAVVEQEVIYRQTYRGLNGAVAYPFDQTRRIEFGTGYQQVTFDQQVRTITTSRRTGERLGDDTQTTSLIDPLHLGSASIAFVTDSSVFGATSPVAGRRSRFEISPTAGTLSFTTALADYRRYFTPARFYTIAGRAMHYGRYGGDSENSLLVPLFLGYPELVRGYGLGSFSASECTAGPAGACDVYDRLLGSRMLVGNIELRFPLLRPFGVRSGMYGPLPVEVAFFADAGVAWTKDDRPSAFGGNREPVSSAGITFRASMFGFAVAQVDFAYPFQRPGKGWVWGFSLTPGF